MTTYYERIRRAEGSGWDNEEEEGGAVEWVAFGWYMVEYENGTKTATQVKDALGANSGQKADIQDILDTLPTSLTVVTDVTFVPPGITTGSAATAQRARWSDRVRAWERASLLGIDGLTSDAAMKAALGIS